MQRSFKRHPSAARLPRALGAVLLSAALLAVVPTGLGWSCARGAEAGGGLVVGPMVGHLTMRSASVWAQWTPADAPEPAAPVWMTLIYWPEDAPDRRLRSAPVKVDATNDWIARWRLTGLETGRRYVHQVAWQAGDRQGTGAPGAFTTETLWQWRQDPPPLRVLAGSCAYTNDAEADRPGEPFGRDPSIYLSMAARRPDLTLWLGDSIYLREPDFDDENAMAGRWAAWRRSPALQPLLRTGSHLAVWDDHDYGPNDSNAANTFKQTSLDLFSRYWVNPGAGLPQTPGIFTRASRADVDFFLLDDRWYRDSDRSRASDRRMFGEAQMAWLRNALLQSTATWKVIVSGSQLFNDQNRYEGWNHFPQERQTFVDWLSAQRVRGVLFLSGDRHFSAAFRVDRPDSYPLHEFTCSPLTARAVGNPARDITGNPTLIEGSVVGRNNFCELEFSGKRGARMLSVQMRDTTGALVWSTSLSESGLR